MKENKNIGFINLDSDLQDKINKLMRLYNGTVSGKDPTAWQALINNVNVTLKNLKDNKVDVTELAHYLHKGNDKVTKQMLSDELSAIVTSLEKNKYRGIDDKITYSDLSKDTTDRIERTENRLDYINDYLLNHPVGGGSGPGIDPTLFNSTISNINQRIDDNKDISDVGISKNATDIFNLTKRVSDNESIIKNLGNVYQKLNQPINFKDLPGNVQNTLTTLSGSLPFTQDDKNILMELQSSGSSMNMLIGNFVDDRNILGIYTKKDYDNIYFSVTGPTTGNTYIVKYSLLPDDTHAGQVTNAADEIAGDDSTINIPLFSKYVASVLTSSEITTFNSSLIFSNETKKLYFNKKLIAQKQIRLFEQNITIPKSSYVFIPTSDLLDSAINTNIQLIAQDSNSNIIEASHVITIIRFQDKIQLKNELDENITVKVSIKDYMI